MKLFIAFVACVASMSILQPLAVGQNTGQLRGRITDPSQNVISGAKVEAINVETNVSRTTVSNGAGIYSFPLLSTGNYTLDVRAPGFKTVSRSGITLQVNQTATLNFTMQIGSSTQTVTVKANASQLDTESSTMKEVVGTRRIIDLPLNGRDPLQLILLMPGLVATTSDVGGLQQGGSAPTTINPGIAANGARSNMVDYLLDGAPHNDTYTNVSLAMPVPDALQEFSVQTNNYSAEFGRSAGAIVSAVSRSGTNSLHGDLYEFNRNDTTSAINYFDTQSDGLNRNQFGGTLGGPVYIPHLYNGHGRTFFFFSEQETRQVQTPSSEETTVLTTAQRNGDFSAFPQPIIDPTTGLPFPGNQIPMFRENIVTKNIVDQLLPLPTDPTTGELLFSVPNTYSGRQILIKIDQHFHQADTLGVSYLYNYYFQPANNSTLIFASEPSNTIPNHNIAVNETHIFNPNTLNEFHFAFNWRSAVAQPVWTTSFCGLGMQDVQCASPVLGDFNLNVSGAFYAGVQEQDTTTPSDYSVSDVLRRTEGRHDVSVGFSYQYQKLFKNYEWLINPYLDFESTYTGYGVADFFLGLPTEIVQNAFGQQGNDKMPVYGAFAQDNFHVTKGFALNLGIRWDPYVPYVDTNGRMSLFRPGQQSIVYPNAPLGLVFPGDPGVPEGGSNPEWKNFSPRIGFAWVPFGDTKMSVRAGYGIFYDSAPMSALENVLQNVPPYGTQISLRPPPGNFTNPYAGNDPFPQPFPPTRDSIFPAEGIAAATFTQNFRTPYLQAWNFIVERELHPNWLLGVAYAGSKGTDLLQGWNLNAAVYIPGDSTVENEVDRQPYAPQFGDIQVIASNGNSSFNSLQVSLEKRFSRRFSVHANYTWSKSIDQGSGAGTDWPNFTDNNDFNFDRGPSDFNVPNRFVMSWVWDLPPVSGGPGAVRAITNNWNFSGILTRQSGMPFTIYSGEDNSLTGNGLDRADQIGNPARPSGANPVDEYFNTAAFIPNAIGTYGDIGRNSLSGPGLFDIDVSASKSIPVAKSTKMILRADIFNVFNHPNFYNPDGRFTDGTFGMITSANNPRILQFSAKYVF